MDLFRSSGNIIVQNIPVCVAGAVTPQKTTAWWHFNEPPVQSPGPFMTWNNAALHVWRLAPAVTKSGRSAVSRRGEDKEAAKPHVWCYV